MTTAALGSAEAAGDGDRRHAADAERHRDARRGRRGDRAVGSARVGDVSAPAVTNASNLCQRLGLLARQGGCASAAPPCNPRRGSARPAAPGCAGCGRNPAAVYADRARGSNRVRRWRSSSCNRCSRAGSTADRLDGRAETAQHLDRRVDRRREIGMRRVAMPVLGDADPQTAMPPFRPAR